MTDKYSREIVVMKDYNERECIIYEPSQYRIYNHFLNFSAPVIICPALHIKNLQHYVMFEFEENSQYVKMWNDFPKRRIRLPIEKWKD